MAHDDAAAAAAAAAVAAAETHAEAAARLAATAALPRDEDPLAGSGAPPAEPGAAVVSSDDIMRWTGQVEGEFLAVRGTVSTVSASSTLC